MHLFSGRINRKEYVVGLLLTHATPIVLGGLLQGVNAAADSAILGVVLDAIFLALLVFDFSILIRRVHDLGKSGHYLWFFLVPLFNLYVIYQIVFVKGEPGKNAYGAEPGKLPFWHELLALD